MAAVYAAYVTDSVISFEYEPPDAGEMGRRMTTTLARYPWLLLEDGEGVAGYVYASPHSGRAAYEWSVDVSVYLHARAHRKGYGRRLYLALFELLRAQGFVTAYAGVALPNDASVGLHESLGFTPIGVYRDVGFKHGRWVDVGYWQLALTTPPADPGRTLSFPDLPPDVVASALAR